MPSENIPSTSPFPFRLHSAIARIPVMLWAPFATSAMVTIIASIGIAAHDLLLFASLGPSAYLAARKPQERSTTFYNVFAGHMTGMGAGFLAVFALSAWNAPIPFVTSYSVAPVRLFAVAIASSAAFLRTRCCMWAATEATTILVATGFFPNWHGRTYNRSGRRDHGFSQ